MSGSKSRVISMEKAPLYVRGRVKSSDLGEIKDEAGMDQGILPLLSQCSSPGATGISGLHSRRTRGDRHSSRVEAKNPALLSNRDGYLLELTGWTQGSQAS